MKLSKISFLALLLTLLLVSCSAEDTGILLSEVTPDAGKLNLAGGVSFDEPAIIVYQIGKASLVSIQLRSQGQIYQLRQNEERVAGTYNLVINGAIEQQEVGLSQTRLLPNGDYEYRIKAMAGSETLEKIGKLTVINNPADNSPPQIEALSANPSVISPNFDAREDAALLGWRTTRPATVTVSIEGRDGFSKIIKTVKNQPAQEDKAVFNGLDQRNEPLTDGIYTYTVQASDNWGNVTRRASQFEIKGGGRPDVLIGQASIGPTAIIRGNLITVTARVRNVGKVPIRSQGPPSGYVYSTREVFSSIADGRYNDAAGFWRLGVDFESNSGGGASRYPFRWGLGEELLPGQEVEVIGVIRVERPEEKLRFYVGLIQEQISLPQDRLQVTEVKISY